jgi:hypothetical protein
MIGVAADREVLRELGSRVAEIAAQPVQQETIGLWKRLNGLRPERPMVYLDQLPWHELAQDPLLVNRCVDPFNRGLEIELRRTLYRWEHIRADMAVEPEILIPKVLRLDGFGIQMSEETEATDATNNIVSHHFFDQLANEEDAEKIRTPRVWLDAEATAQVEERAHDLFDGVLPIRMQGWVPTNIQWPGLESQPETRQLVHDWPDELLAGGANFWDTIAFWRGVDAVLLDLADRPEHLHRIIDRLVTAYLGMLDQMEEQALLGHSMTVVHCTPAWTDELPHEGFDPARPRAEDLWTMGMAQLFTSCSPAMFREFEVEYTSRWYARFGLGYYGCCDVLDRNIDNIRMIPNVRKISISPWANVDRSADGIGHDYVMSRKPNPALLAMDSWEPEAVEKELRATVETCRRTGTPVELILKDVSTIRYDARRLWEWVDIAMRVVNE